ncbi:MAG TPA: energy transducer TonB [Longimicrobiaceae bacterium]
MGSRRGVMALGCAAWLAAGCATSGPTQREQLLGGGDAPAGRRCWLMREPERLPAAAELIDSAAFRAETTRLWAAAGRPGGFVLFTIRHAAEGMQVRRVVIETTLPAALADTLQKLVFARRRETAPAREEWGVRLRVDPRDDVRLRVGRSLECAPRPRDREYQNAGTPFDVRETRAEGMAAPPLTDADVAWVRVRTNADGLVTDARVERGPPRGPWEQRLLAFVRAMSFWPALQDGQPVAGELALPVRLSTVR